MGVATKVAQTLLVAFNLVFVVRIKMLGLQNMSYALGAELYVINYLYV